MKRGTVKFNETEYEYEADSSEDPLLVHITIPGIGYDKWWDKWDGFVNRRNLPKFIYHEIEEHHAEELRKLQRWNESARS